MSIQLLVTLGPSSLNEEVMTQCDHFGIFVFRINLSHTPLEKVRETIDAIRRYTKTPICLDSEGAQIRNQIMQNGNVAEEGKYTELLERKGLFFKMVKSQQLHAAA